MAKLCTSIQKSLGWCQGTPELPGVKRRIYYLAKSEIVVFPQLPRDELGRATSAILAGSFTLAAVHGYVSDPMGSPLIREISDNTTSPRSSRLLIPTSRLPA